MRIKTIISQKVAVVALFVVLTFASVELTAVTLLSESFVVAQGLGNDPISGCFKTIGKTEVGTGDIQNWTESIQNFVSLIPADNTITLINKYVTQLGGSGPITDMAGIWDVLNNGNMTAHDRKMVLTEVNSLLASRPTRVYPNTTGCAK